MTRMGVAVAALCFMIAPVGASAASGESFNQASRIFSAEEIVTNVIESCVGSREPSGDVDHAMAIVAWLKGKRQD